RPRKPTTQGQVERSNGTLKSCISRLLALEVNKIWYKELDNVVLEYNTTVHSFYKKTPEQNMFKNKGYNTPGEYYTLKEDISYLTDEDSIPSDNIEETRSQYLNRMIVRSKNILSDEV
ncbi:hypothetical protein CDIK_3237, partial [Cucumispora dikerogammari]